MCKVPARSYRTIKKYLFLARYLLALNMVKALVRIGARLLVRLLNALINNKNMPISDSAVHIFDICALQDMTCPYCFGRRNERYYYNFTLHILKRSTSL